VWWPADRVEVDRNLEILWDLQEENDYTEAWDAGQRMSLDEALEFVMENEEAN
jgi:hypothetical protein